MIVQEIPALVLKLADQVNMTPIAWKIDPTTVTIVFEQGPKMVFDFLDKNLQIPPAPEIATHKPVVFTKAASSKSPNGRKPRK